MKVTEKELKILKNNHFSKIIFNISQKNLISLVD
jgi:hypothetical protein